MSSGGTDNLKWALMPILVITALIFLPALDNGLTNWDDAEYITENTLIHSLSADSLKGMFTSNLTGKYHPLTLLTYALEYRWFQATPRVYHLDNLLLHLINVALVFTFTWLLFRKPAVSMIMTILFAVHPLHAEPVVWAAGRKDVLSTLFYLAALLSWLGYVRQTRHKPWLYSLSLFSFILAVLAKASAVTLPPVLILLDYYLRRPVNKNTVLEKIPFFLGALWLGSLTWSAVEATRAFPVTELFNTIDRPFLSLYAIFLYVCKLLFPVTVSCFYPLPVKDGLWFSPFVYVVSAAVVFGGWLLWHKRRRIGRETLFGILFFLVLILPVLHFLKVNDSIVYDRFGYLSSLGIFLVLANAYRYLAQDQFPVRLPLDIRKLARILFPAYLLYLSFFSWQRAQVWKNNLTLWSDVIRQFPNSGLGYHNRVHAWTEVGRHDLALKDASKEVMLVPDYVNAYLNRALIYTDLKVYDLALRDFSRAIKIKPDEPIGYLERGNILLYFRQHEAAIQDFTTVLRLDPRQGKAYNNRGNIYLMTGRQDLAMADYTRAIETDPSYANAYLNRAAGHLMRGEIPQAREDLNSTLRLDPLNVLARQRLAELAKGTTGL